MIADIETIACIVDIWALVYWQIYKIYNIVKYWPESEIIHTENI